MSNPIRKCGLASLYLIKGVRVLLLYGTEEEMAYQHGMLLKEDIQKGVIHYLANKLEFEVKSDGPLKNHPWLQKMVLTYVNQYVFKNLIRHISPEYKEMVEVLGKAAHVEANDILKAASMPDAMTILSSWASGRYFFPKIHPEIFGCTSFVVFNQMVPEGELMHGRNLDFPAANFWDRYTTVLYHTPRQGQKYCSITTAGVHLPGVTGFNESGLILGIHQLFTTEVTCHGMPIVLICSEIIKKAKSIDEAVSIVKNVKRAGNWAIVLSNFKEKRAVTIETSPKEVYVREAQNGLMAQSNYCFGSKLKNHELFFNWTTSEDNLYRHKRLIDGCLHLKGLMDEKKGIDLLGDHMDPISQKTKALGRVVSTIYNVQSAFFRPERKQFWISTGGAPANLTSFVELPFDWPLHIQEGKEIFPNDFSKTSQGQAMREYTHAYHYFSNEKDFQKTLEHIERALALDSQEFAYHLAKGFILIKLHDFQSALKAFETCQTIEMSFHEKSLIALYQGRTYDLLGNREMAKKCYEPTLQSIKLTQPKQISGVEKNTVGTRGGCALDEKLRKAFLASWRKPYTKKDIEKTIFQFIFADFLAY